MCPVLWTIFNLEMIVRRDVVHIIFFLGFRLCHDSLAMAAEPRRHRCHQRTRPRRQRRLQAFHKGSRASLTSWTRACMTRRQHVSKHSCWFRPPTRSKPATSRADEASVTSAAEAWCRSYRQLWKADTVNFPLLSINEKFGMVFNKVHFLIKCLPANSVVQRIVLAGNT